MYCTVHLNNFFLSFPNPLCSVVYYISLQTKPPPGSFLPSNQKKKKKSTSGSSVAVACLLGTYAVRAVTQVDHVKRSVTASQRHSVPSHPITNSRLPYTLKPSSHWGNKGLRGKKILGDRGGATACLLAPEPFGAPCQHPKSYSLMLSHTRFANLIILSASKSDPTEP